MNFIFTFRHLLISSCILLAGILNWNMAAEQGIADTLPINQKVYDSAFEKVQNGKVTAVVGLQFGDEGKGKIVDALSQYADIVVRAQSGCNAAHAVQVNGIRHVFRLIPAGMLRAGMIGVIAHGMVINPETLIQEIEQLKVLGINITPENLKISSNAHITMNYHKDLYSFDAFRSHNIGSTRQGAGPTYVDKAQRIGIRLIDFVDPHRFSKCLKENLDRKSREYSHYYSKQFSSPYDFDVVYNYYESMSEQLRPFMINTTTYLTDEIVSGRRIIVEAAQAIGLDQDHGAYPYVTASSSTVAGLATGSGIPPAKFQKVVGVLGAYTVQSGTSGPSPFFSGFSDQNSDFANKIRDCGNEYGPTIANDPLSHTPRRIGWIDIPLARYATRVNGVTDVALTKIDVLDSIHTIGICVGYKCTDRKTGEEVMLSEYTPEVSLLFNVVPVIEELSGWESDTSHAVYIEDLPLNAQLFVHRIEELLGVPITMVSNGPERSSVLQSAQAEEMLYN